MQQSVWAWPGVLGGVVLAALLGCGGGRTATPSCDGGSCEADAGGFPYIGPSCTAAEFPASCWGCVRSACPTTESCLGADCAAFFTCYCACAAGDGACRAACPQTAACQTCAQNITVCQRSSCPAECGADGGAPRTICTSVRTCAAGATLQACSVTSGGLCQSQYYTIGSQTYACAACGDCTAAATQAGTACP